MRAAVFVKTGMPWTIQDKPLPTPSDGQVLIKIRACGLCGTDIHMHHGVFPVPTPCIPGHEPVGDIVATGPGVFGFKVGDRVGVSWVQKGCGRCLYCQRGEEKYCTDPLSSQGTWVGMGGGMSEYMLAWASGCTLLPENLSYVNAAPIFCAGFTIASGFQNGNPLPGDTIGVLGVGGLGHLAIQYAKAKGHRVIAITTTQAKAPLAKQFGADEVCVIDDNCISNLQKLGGLNVLLYTASCSDLVSSLLPAMCPEGRVVIMGLDKEPIKLSPISMITKQLKIIGSMQNNKKDLIDILQLTAAGKVVPMIEVYPFEKIATAVQRLEEGKVRMRAVVTMGE
jgi:D-arabinose 1-dehydrogenase-like Zn-dependent alcohol dehydrogenase